MAARVVGLGQRAAGDDGAGLAVLDALRGVESLELHACCDAGALVELLRTPEPVIVVDAVVGAGEPGRVLVVDPDRLEAATPLSTHGIGVMEAIGLARALYPTEVSRHLHLVGVTIQPPGGLSPELSPAVAAAVPLAAARIRRLAGAG